MMTVERQGVVATGLLEALRNINGLLFAQVETEDRLFFAVTQALTFLGLRGAVMLQSGDSLTLTVRQAVTHPLVGRVEQLTGMRTVGHRIDPTKSSVYRDVLAGQVVYLQDTRTVLAELVPPLARPFLELLHKASSGVPGVYAPLRSGGRVVGILNASGPTLTRADVSAMEALASGVSLGLDTIYLRRLLSGGERARTGAVATPLGPTACLAHSLELLGQKATPLQQQEGVAAVKALVHALEEQRAALNHHAVVSITDTEGTITYANDRFCALSGYSRAELVGNTHRLVNAGYHPKEFFRELWTTVKAGRVWQGELCNRAKDGRRFWLAATIVPLLDDGGRPREFIAFRTDITLQKDTAEQLRLARDAADAASRAKSSFLANTSHELRTPMNAILGLTRLALEQKPQGELRENLELVLDSANGLLSTLNDILDFSKIEAGRLALEPRTFELADEIVRSLRAFSHMAKTRDLALSWTLGPSVRGFVSGDPHRLRQIINNLVGNALKFTERGGVTVTVTRDLDHVTLEVADTGVGISTSELVRVFAPFEQADASITRRFGGTGLGLSVTRSLATLMGGEVKLTSTEGVGTTASVRMKLPPTTPTAPSPAVVAASAESTSASPRALRVLVAEDNIINQRVAQRLLEHFGHQVELVADGRAAVTRALEARFDLILMDLNMPGMDGLEATRLIRERERDAGLGHTPIIAVTANAMLGDQQMCLQAGMDDYVSKPIDPEVLSRVIASCAAPRVSR